MTTRISNFKSSVNIRFDLGKPDVFMRYLPTPSHAESLLGLLKGFNNKEHNHSHIIIGPYGTGKSLLATIVSGIVSKNVNQKTFNLLKQKFNKVDDEIFDELNKIQAHDKKYLPIILSGNEGRFRHAILSAILRTLDQNGIQIVVPGVVNKILSTIDLWKLEYQKTYKQFKNLLKERNIDIELWRLEILSHNKPEIEWFSAIFPTLTSGAEFVSDYSEDFIGQLKVVIDELKKLNIGIFITYDEFGRFLQNLDINEIHETMQDLQDLAELSDHYTHDLHLLLVTHKNLTQYFNRLNKEYKNEFQRIEKRFKSYHIDSDKATFIRLTESILTSIKKEYYFEPITNETITNNLRKYPLFPELNQSEIEKIIIEGIYPIHPITLYLLPFLSNKFGQNERTLFTFLESNDKGGLISFISNNKGYYLPDNLLDYFFPDLDIEIEDNFSYLKIYKKLLIKIPNLENISNKNNFSILKLITLWGLAGLQSKYKLTTDFIAFSLDLSEDEVEVSLTNLARDKAVRFNSVLGYWELFEGSGVDIDKLILDKLEITDVSRKRRLTILESHLNQKFYLANQYNDEKSMTRFASVNLVYSSDILNNVYDSNKVRHDKNSDALINFIILESSEQYEDVRHQVVSSNDIHSIYCLSTYTFDYIEKQVINYQIIDNMLQDQEVLMLDKDLENELLIRKEDISYVIKDFLSVFTNFDSNLIWSINGVEHTLANEIVLEQKISDLMYELFPDTPEIRNDSYNRRKINNVQKKAGQTVVNHILNHYSEPKFKIEGNGPDYLIYATVFKNNNLDITKLDSIDNPFYKKIRIELNDYLVKNSSGKLNDLVSILKEKPFGIREPLIPILLVSLLRDKWDKLMFYKNEMFIPSISGETLFKMVDEADEYDYLFFEYDKQLDTFFDFLEDEFRPYISNEDQNKPKPIRITTAMLKWLRSLPRYTQISGKMNQEFFKLKDNIRQAEVDPKNTIEKLYHEYHSRTDEIRSFILDLSSYLAKRKEELEETVYQLLGTNSFNETESWAQKQNSSYKKENKLVRSLINVSNANEWINELAYGLVGVEIENWSDTTSEMFEVQLQNEYNKVINNTNTLGEYVQFSVNGLTKSVRKTELSTKSKTIYNNVSRIINNGGRNVPKEEIEYLIIRLLEDFVD